MDEEWRECSWPFPLYRSGSKSMGVKRKKGVRVNFGGSSTKKSIGGKVLKVSPVNGKVSLTHCVNGERYLFTEEEINAATYRGKAWPRHDELNSKRTKPS